MPLVTMPAFTLPQLPVVKLPQLPVVKLPTLQRPAWVERYGSAHAMVADARRQLHCAYGRHGRRVMSRFMHAPLGSDLSVATLTGRRSTITAALATETDPATRVVLLAALDAMNAARPTTHVGATGTELEISATAGPARMPLPAETPPALCCAHERRHLVNTHTEPDAHPRCTPGVMRRVHARCGGTD
jgi:hypothetical protein